MIFFSIYTLNRIIELLSLQWSFLDHVPFDYLFIIRVFVYFKQGLRIHGHKFYVYYQMVFSKFLTFPEKNVPLLITLNFVCRGSIWLWNFLYENERQNRHFNHPVDLYYVYWLHFFPWKQNKIRVIVALTDLGYDKSYTEIISIIYEWISPELIGCRHTLTHTAGKVL